METEMSDRESRRDAGEAFSSSVDDTSCPVDVRADLDACETAVRELVIDIGPDGVVEVMGAWLSGTPRLVAEAEELVSVTSETAQATLNRVAHSIKGSSSIFSLDAIVARANALETLAARGDYGPQSKVIQELSALVTATMPGFSRLRAKFLAP